MTSQRKAIKPCHSLEDIQKAQLFKTPSTAVDVKNPKCPVCKGLGWQIVQEFKDQSNTQFSLSTEDCIRCKGKKDWYLK
jgi:hypothetical protein